MDVDPVVPAAPKGGRPTLSTVGNAVARWVHPFGLYLNWFPAHTFQPNYLKETHSWDFTVQSLFSVICICVVWTVLGLQMVRLIKEKREPVLTFNVSSFPTPTQMLAWFRDQDSGGELQGLSCPCTKSSIYASDISNYTWAPDSFCVSLLAASEDLASTLLDDMLNSTLNTACVADFPAFLANITALATRTRMFDPSDPDFAAQVEAFANATQEGLCGMVFGAVPVEPNFFPSSVPTCTAFGNACANGNNSELPQLFPTWSTLNVATEASVVSIVQLQQTRLRNLLQEALTACTMLRESNRDFEAAFRKLLQLPSPVALSPMYLSVAMDRVFTQLLQQHAARLSALVPGTAPSPMTMATSNALSFDFRLSRFLARTSPPFEYSAADFPFSSRLPFVRTDFIAAAGRQFYTLTRFEAGRAISGSGRGFPLPVMAWECVRPTNFLPCPSPPPPSSPHAPLLPLTQSPGPAQSSLCPTPHARSASASLATWRMGCKRRVL